MKLHATIFFLAASVLFCTMPVLAQRPGGGGHGGGRPSAGFSGGGGHYGSSSFAGSSRSYSTPSQSSRPASYGSSSRVSSSRSSYSSSPSYSSGSRSSVGSRSSNSSRYAGASKGSGRVGSGRVAGTMSRPSSSRVSSSRPTANAGVATASSRPTSGVRTAGGGSESYAHPSSGRPAGSVAGGHPQYATARHPHGVMPRAMRPMRPAPYFYHPMHHCMVHCHPIFWDPMPYRHLYWAGFWGFCYGYWDNYAVRDIVVVKDYVRENYGADLVTYVISGDYMYALTIGEDGNTYIQIFDKTDNLLAEQQVNKKYCQMEVDKENGGCWLMKKRGKDPLLFFYNDGELLIYEADDK
ncbi:MAG: hypothetical protein KBT04_01070 [Bacteroidales bacterium]|nr:hypothetical protein [Candidatus Colimorpha onthohippi]